MMDSGRVFRAVITIVTLAATLWLLRLVSPSLSGRDWSALPKAEAASQAATTIALPLRVAVPPTDVKSLPLVAFENTCFDGTPVDLSACTGMLSGGDARTYHFAARAGERLSIRVEPQSEIYDVAFALFDQSSGRCLLGRDNDGIGRLESAQWVVAENSLYELIVGGYGVDCGPYLLTVEAGPRAITQVVDASATAGRNGMVISWQSFAEVELEHFRLYRVRGTERERIAVLRAHGTAAGTAGYRFVDRAPLDNATYELEAFSGDGRSERIAVKPA